MRLTAFISVMLVGLITTGFAAELENGSFEGKAVREVKLKYLAVLPDGYSDDEDRKWPLILFLHGAGERGEDLSRLRGLGPVKRALEQENFPFLVVAPLCPLGRAWHPDELKTLLDEVEKRYRVDEGRVYVTGFSMGGAGTWALAMEAPGRFAAIAPLCGRVIPLLAGNLWCKPVWVFHGEKDEVVPISQSQEMVDYLRLCEEADVRFTVLEGEGHEIWYQVYSSNDIYAWFLKHSRTPHP